AKISPSLTYCAVLTAVMPVGVFISVISVSRYLIFQILFPTCVIHCFPDPVLFPDVGSPLTVINVMLLFSSKKEG
ncbi:hypothetical protein ABO61_26485, partial [Salmonella enterica subsp. enterica]|nr:hypothetical protein [Salmonella enterica subsp. enterica serovar Glostrup]